MITAGTPAGHGLVGEDYKGGIETAQFVRSLLFSSLYLLLLYCNKNPTEGGSTASGVVHPRAEEQHLSLSAFQINT